MKKRITISIETELLDKLDDNVKSKKFASRSHGIAVLLDRLK